MARDVQVVENYLAKWDRFAQGESELVAYLREDRYPFEAALTRLLNAKDNVPRLAWSSILLYKWAVLSHLTPTWVGLLVRFSGRTFR